VPVFGPKQKGAEPAIYTGIALVLGQKHDFINFRGAASRIR